ncbi:MAG: hypothetical protein QOF89_3437 [Acidobacteriota bacterium]|jgi:hypothetical protein|nr:hypothetical protein [Acidobacteriota bacterium]
MNDDRLSQLLREGDPAAQDAGLNPDEIHTMRRTVLTAIPESRSRLGWLPLAAGIAGVIVLALLMARAPWRQPPAAPPAAPQVAAVITPAPAPAVAPAPEPAKRSRPSHRRAVRAPKALPARPEALMTVASLPEKPEPATREIRFSTSGGTRVIWQMPVNDSR